MYRYTKVLVNNPVYAPQKCMYMLHNRRGVPWGVVFVGGTRQTYSSPHIFSPPQNGHLHNLCQV
nr:MAG TPA: hypothetical protein [Caudoviricetes sp.]